MRILMVGADSRYAIERPYLKYLSGNPLVSKIDFFAAQNIFLNYYQKNIFNKIVYRAGLSNILTKVNEALKEKFIESKPDVVFVFKGMEIFPSTLQWMKQQGAKLANYNPDNPFIFSNRGSGNRNVTDSIPLFDLFMSYDKGICKKMESEYHIKSELLPFGFEIDAAKYESYCAEPEKNKLCFIGNTDEYRLAFINDLAASGIPIDLFGMNWHAGKLHKNVTFKGPVFDDGLWKALRSYRIQLNLMRIHNPESHNMRSFEIGGVGGIQLAPRTTDHENYFKEGSEIFLYTTLADCIQQVNMLQSLSAEQANEIRSRARNRSINSGYSYEHRSATVAGYLHKLYLEK